MCVQTRNVQAVMFKLSCHDARKFQKCFHLKRETSRSVPTFESRMTRTNWNAFSTCVDTHKSRSPFHMFKYDFDFLHLKFGRVGREFQHKLLRTKFLWYVSSLIPRLDWKFETENLALEVEHLHWGQYNFGLYLNRFHPEVFPFVAGV